MLLDDFILVFFYFISFHFFILCGVFFSAAAVVPCCVRVCVCVQSMLTLITFVIFIESHSYCSRMSVCVYDMWSELPQNCLPLASALFYLRCVCAGAHAPICCAVLLLFYSIHCFLFAFNTIQPIKTAKS